MEKKEYLTQQLITYIGNKRSLLDFIGRGIGIVQKRLNKKKLRLFDVFSGSGIVARFFKQYSDLLIVNDLEKYSAVINECYLSNENELDLPRLRGYYDEITFQTGKNLSGGIITELYSPMDENAICENDRVFYTKRNAMYLDTARQSIGKIPADDQKFFLAPLLSEAAVHANTAGVFKGFYKNENGAGQFGGKNRNSLTRIKGNISLPFPVFSNYNCRTIVFNGNSNEVIRKAPEADASYIDPPYNQHPYGSNYFMLNLIVDYMRPEKISKVSGIPGNWNRSDYNVRRKAFDSLADLVRDIKSKFVLVSFNSEGFVSFRQLREMLEKNGRLEILETDYNVYKGSRNLSGRGIHVKEYLFVLEKH